MNVMVSDLDDNGEAKRTNFYDIPIYAGKEMSSIIEVKDYLMPDYTIQVLNQGQEEIISPNAVLTQNDFRNISINAITGAGGMAQGTDKYTLNDYAIVIAVPNRGYKTEPPPPKPTTPTNEGQI